MEEVTFKWTWKDEHGVGIKKVVLDRGRAVSRAQSCENGVSLICPSL